MASVLDRQAVDVVALERLAGGLSLVLVEAREARAIEGIATFLH